MYFTHPKPMPEVILQAMNGISYKTIFSYLAENKEFVQSNAALFQDETWRTTLVNDIVRKQAQFDYSMSDRTEGAGLLSEAQQERAKEKLHKHICDLLE